MCGRINEGLSMGLDHEWMYSSLKEGLQNQEFLDGLDEFTDFACGQVEFIDGNKIRCPCNHRKCQNHNFEEVEVVKYHLARHKLVLGYYKYMRHGETNEGKNKGLYRQATFCV